MKFETLAKNLLVWALALIFLVAAFSLWALSAHAQERGWLPPRWHKDHRYIYHGKRRTLRQYRSIEEALESEKAPRCLGRIYSDKGRELSTEEAAVKDAERSWGALIREERGEKWMDLKYAERYESRCNRSSTGESATSQVVGAITGGNAGLLYRCRVWAEPCQAPRTNDGKDR